MEITVSSQLCKTFPVYLSKVDLKCGEESHHQLANVLDGSPHERVDSVILLITGIRTIKFDALNASLKGHMMSSEEFKQLSLRQLTSHTHLTMIIDQIILLLSCTIYVVRIQLVRPS